MSCLSCSNYRNGISSWDEPPEPDECDKIWYVYNRSDGDHEELYFMMQDVMMALASLNKCPYWKRRE